MSTLLTDLERPGSAILPQGASLEERAALAIHLGTLKAQGHAISADEVFEHKEPSGAIRVIHFLTCQHPKCKGRAI